MTKHSENTEPSNSTKPVLSKVLFKDCYRIVNDSYGGYEVQVKRWFFPFFWFEKVKYINCNTFSSVEEAKEWIEKGCPKDVKIKDGSIVFWKNCR
jgi:DNA primase catalytic subunit